MLISQSKLSTVLILAQLGDSGAFGNFLPAYFSWSTAGDSRIWGMHPQFACRLGETGFQILDEKQEDKADLGIGQPKI